MTRGAAVNEKVRDYSARTRSASGAASTASSTGGRSRSAAHRLKGATAHLLRWARTSDPHLTTLLPNEHKITSGKIIAQSNELAVA
jgi:hypothetical protein